MWTECSCVPLLSFGLIGPAGSVLRSSAAPNVLGPGACRLMENSDARPVRRVRCPRCHCVLEEPGAPVYQCGGFGTSLRGNFRFSSCFQGRSQLKTNPGAPSIKYIAIYAIVEEIHGKFEVDISKFWFYCGARAPGKANVASPLQSLVVYDRLVNKIKVISSCMLQISCHIKQ